MQHGGQGEYIRRPEIEMNPALLLGAALFNRSLQMRGILALLPAYRYFPEPCIWVLRELY